MECCGGCNKDNKRELINNTISQISNKYIGAINNEQTLHKITEEIKQKIEEIL